MEMNDEWLIREQALAARFERLPDWIKELQQARTITMSQRNAVGCIGIRFRINFGHLCIGSRQPYDLEYIAWASRNLLELLIWAKYVTASTENAERFRQDEIVDFAEWQQATMRLGQNYDSQSNDLGTLEQQGVWLREKKVEEGIDAATKHLNIGTVAKELGMAGIFYGVNAVLSKLVHPTALSIMLETDRDSEERLRAWMRGLGIGAAEDGLSSLVTFCESVGINGHAIS